MGSSSIKINSISIDLAAANEVDSGKCYHFSLRGYVAEKRERDHGKCWPFSEDSVELRNHESYTRPSLPVVKSRWWRCSSCIKDINLKEIDNDNGKLKPHCQLTEKKLDGGSLSIPSRRNQNSLIATDKKEQKINNHTATFLKKVRRRAKDASTFKSKSKKCKEKAKISTDISWKESQEAFNGSPEVAGVVDDTPNKPIKKNRKDLSMEPDEFDNVSAESRQLLGQHRSRRSRKVRLLSEILSNRNKETPSKKGSARGRKRKSAEDEECNYASRILSTMGKTSDNASSEDNIVSGAESRPVIESQSTDSGFDKEDLIKGKQRNKRFQVIDERFPEPSSQKECANHVHSSLAEKEFVPSPLHIQRTEKDLTLAKKRKRKAKKDEKKRTVDDGSLVKLRKTDNFSHVGPRDIMPQSTRDFLNSNWLDNSCAKLSAGASGHINTYTAQPDDRPVFPLPLQEKYRFKDHFRDFGSTFKSNNADGGLRTGVNVDFSSQRYNSGPFSLNDNRRQTFSTEVAGCSRSPQKDIYSAHRKGKEVVVQEHSEAPRIQSNASEQIDDIPMEIIELMAKNQYERCLPDKEEDKQPSQTTTNVSKNALLIDLNETYDNTMENALRQLKHLGTNSDATTMDGHFMTGKQSSLELFPTNQPYNVLSSGFGVSPVTRQIQFSGVVGPNQHSNHNCQWPGSVKPTMASHPNPFPSPFRVLRGCKTCQSVQQQPCREASQPIWPSSMTPSHRVSLSMSHKFPDQSTKLDNSTTRNLNFDNGRQKPLENYSNESSIPAMHLLSLMDPRLRSNIPIDQSRNSKFVKGPFPSVHQSKEFIGGPQPTKQWPFDISSTRVTPETSRENFPIIPPVGTSSITFQSGKSSAENANSPFQALWNHCPEKKTKRKELSYNNSHHHHQKPDFASTSSDSGKFQLLGASDSMMLPLKFHMTDNAKKQKTKKPQSNNAVSPWPSKSTFGPVICSVNRNPADFSIPDAPGSVYMIRGEELKVRRPAGIIRKKPSLCKQDALKQNDKSIAPAAENA